MADSNQLPLTQKRKDPGYQPSEAVPEAQEDEFKALEFPDGGIEAWLQVLGSFLCLMNTWGVINSFGVFQTYYAESLLVTRSNSDISWIGSFQAFIVLMMGSFTGPLFDIGYFYLLLWSGSILFVFGMMMTSICSEYWQIFLAQGLCVGIGAGLLLVPSSAIIGLYFSKYNAGAQGIAASGSSLGGFGWTMRVMAFIMLATLAISCAVMRDRLTSSRSGHKQSLLDLSAFKEVPFCFFSAAIFFGYAGSYIPFFYVSDYMTSIASSQKDLAFYFIAIQNAASAFGRIIPNQFADSIGCLNVMIPCITAAAILAWGWIADRTFNGMIAFSVLYGFCTGCFVSLPPPVVVSLSPSIEKIGVRLGMVYTIGGFGILIGNPVAGALLGDGSQYLGLQVFCASAVTCAAIFTISARISKGGLDIKVRA